MGIGAVSGLGSMSYASFGNYKVNSINGNPRSLDPIEKIGEENYNSKPFATVSKNEEGNQADVVAATPKEFNFDAAMSRMMIGSRYNAENIPFAGAPQI